jgi:hypothetical protein
MLQSQTSLGITTALTAFNIKHERQCQVMIGNEAINSRTALYSHIKHHLNRYSSVDAPVDA